MAHRRTDEAEGEMDRMIVAFVTVQSPEVMTAWVGRQRGRTLPAPERTNEETVAARDRALALLGMQFPGMVKVRPT